MLETPTGAKKGMVVGSARLGRAHAGSGGSIGYWSVRAFWMRSGGRPTQTRLPGARPLSLSLQRGHTGAIRDLIGSRTAVLAAILMPAGTSTKSRHSVPSMRHLPYREEATRRRPRKRYRPPLLFPVTSFSNLASVDDSALRGFIYEACEAFGNGMTGEDIYSMIMMVAEDMDQLASYSYFLGAGVNAVCPQYEDRLEV